MLPRVRRHIPPRCVDRANRNENIFFYKSSDPSNDLSPDVVDGADSTRVVKNALGERSLATVDMGRYANISRSVDVPSRRRISLRHLRWLGRERPARAKTAGHRTRVRYTRLHEKSGWFTRCKLQQPPSGCPETEGVFQVMPIPERSRDRKYFVKITTTSALPASSG